MPHSQSAVLGARGAEGRHQDFLVFLKLIDLRHRRVTFSYEPIADSVRR